MKYTVIRVCVMYFPVIATEHVVVDKTSPMASPQHESWSRGHSADEVHPAHNLENTHGVHVTPLVCDDHVFDDQWLFQDWDWGFDPKPPAVAGLMSLGQTIHLNQATLDHQKRVLEERALQAQQEQKRKQMETLRAQRRALLQWRTEVKKATKALADARVIAAYYIGREVRWLQRYQALADRCRLDNLRRAEEATRQAKESLETYRSRVRTLRVRPLCVDLTRAFNSVLELSADLRTSEARLRSALVAEGLSLDVVTTAFELQSGAAVLHADVAARIEPARADAAHRRAVLDAECARKARLQSLINALREEPLRAQEIRIIAAKEETLRKAMHEEEEAAAAARRTETTDSMSEKHVAAVKRAWDVCDHAMQGVHMAKNVLKAAQLGFRRAVAELNDSQGSFAKIQCP